MNVHNANKELDTSPEQILDEFGKIASRLSNELDDCQQMLLEIQALIVVTNGNSNSKEYIEKIQNLDYVTQCTGSISHILKVLATFAECRQLPVCNSELQKSVLEEVRRRVWMEDTPPQTIEEKTSGSIDWL